MLYNGECYCYNVSDVRCSTRVSVSDVGCSTMASVSDVGCSESQSAVMTGGAVLG